MHHFKEIIIAHGWGWFIDTEIKNDTNIVSKPIIITENRITYNKKENYNIRSYKSLKNLSELENGSSDKNSNINNKLYNKLNIYSLIEQTIKIISVIICGIVLHKVVIIFI